MSELLDGKLTLHEWRILKNNARHDNLLCAKIDRFIAKHESKENPYGLPWEYQSLENGHGRIFFRGEENGQTNTRDCHMTERQALLMSYAPKLAENLEMLRRHDSIIHGGDIRSVKLVLRESGWTSG